MLKYRTLYDKKQQSTSKSRIKNNLKKILKIFEKSGWHERKMVLKYRALHDREQPDNIKKSNEKL